MANDSFDNGPQFVSVLFESTCEELELIHERIPPKTPNMNAHIKSFHRLLEDDCLSRYEFATYTEAYENVLEFMEFYNLRRLHYSLYNTPPMEFHKKPVETGLQPKRGAANILTKTYDKTVFTTEFAIFYTLSKT